MQSKRFYRLGQFIYQFRTSAIIVWSVAILICLPFLNDIINPFQATGFVANHSQSDLANEFMNQKLGYGHNQFLILYHSEDLLATEPVYQHKIKYSLSGLKNFPVKHEIVLPENNSKQISKDKHTAYAVVLLKTDKILSRTLTKEFQNLIKQPKDMIVQLGGEPIFVARINEQTQHDLFKADFIAVPVTIIALLVIFGTVVAAMLPLCLGGGCAVLILTILYGLGHLLTLSIFTLNIALLLGLCLSLDYALFIIYRFREELNQQPGSVEAAITKTIATAGKAVFYSGVAVFISISALLFFPINVLFSIGIGGLVAVFVAVSVAVTLLPAILALIGHRINALAIRKINFQSNDPHSISPHNYWYKIAATIVKRPVLFSLSTLVFLLMLGYTITNIKVGISDFHVLPDHSENQLFFDTFKKNFNEQKLNPINMIISSQHGSILSKKHITHLVNFVGKIKKNTSVSEVDSIVSMNPTLTIAQYQAMYQQHPENLDKQIKLLLDRTTRDHFTVINIISKYPPDSAETKLLVNQLRMMQPKGGLTTQLSGMPVINMDVLTTIQRILPYMMIWIMVLTYVVLMILLRSLFLPFKAIFMNILSLCASYGVLVYIFQEGHFHDLLHFKVQGMVDVSLLLIIFCAIFGFSMDYEVFLLTRIHEAYNTTQDNEKSIIFGIVKSSRIITSAALIVIFLCGSFMVADVLMVKEFGLGIAVAIFVDAFAIRIILVPATMALVKKWNWYLPLWINKLISSE